MPPPSWPASANSKQSQGRGPFLHRALSRLLVRCGRLSSSTISLRFAMADKSSAFECSVCLRLMHEPSTLSCGHSFCAVCLRKCLEHSLRCPSCRVDVPYEAAHAPKVSIALCEALQLLFPDEVHARCEEEKKAKSSEVALQGLPSFPLFVLEPLLPGQVMSLHVFEPRYIRLTERALTEPQLARSFGMIAPAPRPSGLATHGVKVSILEHQRVPGGRFLLTVRAERRFRVLRTWEIDGYRNASVAWAKDDVPQMRSGNGFGGSVEEGAASSIDPEPAFVHAAILADEVRGAIKQWLSIVQRGGFEGRHNEIVEGLADYAPPRVSRWQEYHWDDLERLGLWAAAVINPLPPVGLAPEIRRLALEATDATSRLMLVLGATERSLARLTRPQQSLLSDAYRVLTIVIVLAGLALAHTSILEVMTSWVRELAVWSAPSMTTREAGYLVHKSGLLSWLQGSPA